MKLVLEKTDYHNDRNKSEDPVLLVQRSRIQKKCHTPF